MMMKSLITVGAVAGIGLMWMSGKYLYKKTRADLKSNEDRLCYGPSTLAVQSNLDDENQLSYTIAQCSSAEMPATLNLLYNEILPPQPHCPMINIELQTKSMNPVELLHQLIPGIKYEHEITRKTPVTVRVETIIHGKPFRAQGPTKKHAKRVISMMALHYFYGYDHAISVTQGWIPSLKSFKRIR